MLCNTSRIKYASLGEDQYEQYCPLDIFCATHINSIRVTMMPTQWRDDTTATFICICFYIFTSCLPQSRIDATYLPLSVLFSSRRLFNLLPLLFMLLVILSLLMWSCLYSQHNWRKCCCLDRIDTSIVSHQSPLKTSLLQDDFSSMKRKRRKGKGFWRKGWMNYPSFKVIR